MTVAYSETERVAALAVLEGNGGNLARTARETGISRNTLRAWRAELDTVKQVVSDVVTTEKVDEARALIERFEAVAALGLEVTEASLRKYIDDGVELEPDQLRHVMVGTGIAADKHLDYRDGRKGAQVNVTAQAGVVVQRNTRSTR